MLRRWRRRRAVRRVKPGDGRPLRAFRWWQLLGRSLFTIEHPSPSDDRPTDDRHIYVVDVSFFDFDGAAELYRDGRRHAVAAMPAAFPVPGGVIEVAATAFGMKRVHLVPDSGEERQLQPAPRTGEWWRARLDHRYPRVSAWLARSAIVVLVIGLLLLVPQLVEMVTSIGVVADRVGTFTSPVSLPSWLNTVLLVAGMVAALERALTLRNHWLIDADTWVLG